MPGLTMVVGNKNYSSWSLRAWLALKMTGADFEEVLVPLDEAGTKQELLRHTRSGRVPVLKCGEISIFDSLAICEYLNEQYPDAKLWPSAPEDRAMARAAAAEMHSGFSALRDNMPMNIRSQFPGKGMAPGVQDDINRLTAIWLRGRHRWGEKLDGPFLFGHFTIVDAMYAPVVSRFRTYGVPLGETEQAYADAIWALPAMQEWVEASAREPMVIDSAEF